MSLDLDDAPPRSLAGLPREQWFWGSAAEIASRVRGGSLSAAQAVENALGRIAEVNPRLNCFTEVYAAEARAEAALLDARLAAGAVPGPLAGVPFAIKDLTPSRGHRTTAGCRAYAENVTDYDPVFLRRLRAAGGVLIGKTTCSEMCSAALTETELYGITRNPWNLDHTPGGSSGGSAAAVASGCVPLAEGTDIGGSIRSPAVYCGVVGMKPSSGRIPMDIMPSLFDDMMHFGPIAASVEDAALFLQACAGPDDADPLSLPAAPDGFLGFHGGVRGLRLGVNYDYGYYRMDPEVTAALQRVVAALEAAGATVEPVTLDWSREIDEAWYRGWSVYLAAQFGDFLETNADRVGEVVLKQVAEGRAVSAVEYKRIEVLRSRMWRDLAQVFTRCDALILPATSRTAPPVRMKDEDFFGEDEEGRLIGMSMHLHLNFTPQCPSLSLPVGFSAAGLPIGVQIVGRRFDDAGCLRVARAIEQMPGAGARRPPL